MTSLSREGLVHHDLFVRLVIPRSCKGHTNFVDAELELSVV